MESKAITVSNRPVINSGDSGASVNLLRGGNVPTKKPAEERKVTIRVDQKTFTRLKIMSAKQDLPVNEICLRLLKIYFKKPSIVDIEVKGK
jgi:hypothetical protein